MNSELNFSDSRPQDSYTEQINTINHYYTSGSTHSTTEKVQDEVTDQAPNEVPLFSKPTTLTEEIISKTLIYLSDKETITVAELQTELEIDNDLSIALIEELITIGIVSSANDKGAHVILHNTQ